MPRHYDKNGLWIPTGVRVPETWRRRFPAANDPGPGEHRKVPQNQSNHSQK